MPAINESDVLSFLRAANKPLKAREIAASFQRTLRSEVSRSDVNQILYKLKTRGVAQIDGEFKWTLSPGAGTKNSERADHQTNEPSKHASYYDILQVTRDAHPNVIMKAYKALVALYHPDRSTPAERSIAEERMKLINIAYETLSDSHKRAQYDRDLEFNGSL